MNTTEKQLPAYYIFKADSRPAHWIEVRELKDFFKLEGSINECAEAAKLYFPEEQRHLIKVKKVNSYKLTYVIDTRIHPLKNTTNGATSPNNISRAHQNSPKRPKGRPQKFNIPLDADSGDPAGVAFDPNAILEVSEVHLTYSKHFDLDKLLEHLINKMSTVGNGITIYSLVQETSDLDYLHTHVYLLFKSILKLTDCLFFDYLDYHPNIKIPRTTPPKCSSRVIKGSGAYIACEYHLKNKSSLVLSNYPICDKPIRHLIDNKWKIVGYEIDPSHSTKPRDGLQAWLIEAQSPKPDLKAVSKIFTALDIVKNTNTVTPKTTIPEMFPWQNTATSLVTHDPTKRVLFWIEDKIGGNGKSTLCDHMADNMNAVVVPLAKSSDMRLLAKKELDKNPNPDFIIFDLAKSASSDTNYKAEDAIIEFGNERHPIKIDGFYRNADFYTLLEDLRGGKLTSTKYDSSTQRLNSVPIIVMSNFKPNVRAVSTDRWAVCSMSFDKSFDVIMSGESGKQSVLALGRSIEALGEKLPQLVDLTEEDMEDSIAAMSYEVKNFYWTRGLIPIFNVDQRTSTSYSNWEESDFGLFKDKIRVFSLECRPMTPAEKADYTLKTKRRVIKDIKEPSPAMFKDMRIDDLDRALMMYRNNRKSHDPAKFKPTLIEYFKINGEIL